MPMFTQDERERLRNELVSLAQRDSNLCGAAHAGSGATRLLDRWSDIDLALCLKPNVSCDRVASEWTNRLYERHSAVAHVDVIRGTTLFRVFLLESTLQVDLAFWRAEDFGAVGPNFRLIFGEARVPRPAFEPNPRDLVGMAWLYALHFRSSLSRDRVLQAEYMLSGMRNQIFELMCLRCGMIAKQGRGLDDLPDLERAVAETCIPLGLDRSELKRSFRKSMELLKSEIRNIDTNLEGQLSKVLQIIEIIE